MRYEEIRWTALGLVVVYGKLVRWTGLMVCVRY